MTEEQLKQAVLYQKNIDDLKAFKRDLTEYYKHQEKRELLTFNFLKKSWRKLFGAVGCEPDEHKRVPIIPAEDELLFNDLMLLADTYIEIYRAKLEEL